MECPLSYLTGVNPENSSRGGTRTPDPVINSHLLYHLSYSGIAPKISRSRRLNQPIHYHAMPRFAASFAAVITVRSNSA